MVTTTNLPLLKNRILKFKITFLELFQATVNSAGQNHCASSCKEDSHMSTANNPKEMLWNEWERERHLLFVNTSILEVLL